MRQIIPIVFLLILTTNLFAQISAFSKGSSIIHPAIELFPVIDHANNNIVYANKYKSTLPLTLGYEYGISKRISIGPEATYVSYIYNTASYYYPNSSFKFTYIIPGLKANFHFLFLNSVHWDPYAGVFAGYNQIRSSNSGGGVDGSDSHSGSMRVGLHIGANYYFSSHLGIFTEAGFGVSILRIGLAFKF